MMGRPGDEREAGSGGRSHLRVSHSDREQVIDAVKAAFVQGRLTKDELDARVGQALAAQRCADLAEVTADIPAGPDLARPPKPARAQPHQPGNRAAKRAVQSGACAITALVVAVSAVAVAMGQPGAAVILAIAIVIFAAIATAFVASVLAAVLAVESRRRKRSGGQLPPAGQGGQAPRRPVPADPAGQLPPTDHSQQRWSLTLKRQVAYSRKYSNAGAQPLAWATTDNAC
jgi:Domain of unknown function (DUF1707)